MNVHKKIDDSTLYMAVNIMDVERFSRVYHLKNQQNEVSTTARKPQLDSSYLDKRQIVVQFLVYWLILQFVIFNSLQEIFLGFVLGHYAFVIRGIDFYFLKNGKIKKMDRKYRNIVVNNVWVVTNALDEEDTERRVSPDPVTVVHQHSTPFPGSICRVENLKRGFWGKN